MATRAERFRAEEERSKRPKAATKPKARRAARGDTSAAGVSASERKAGGPSTARRNLSRGREAVYVLEDTAPPLRPSRKSSRRSKAHVKAAVPLTSRQKLRVASPRAQHDRK